MGAVGVVSNGAPTGTWGSGLARATHGRMIRCVSRGIVALH